MPEQGARAAVRDQGGRGARLNPVRRLMLAGAGVIVGGAVIAVGSRLPWATVTLRGSPVSVPGLPRVALAGGKITLDASAIGSGWVFGVGLLIALVPLGWLVLGWQGRLVLGLVAFAAALLVLYQAAGMRDDIVGRARDVALRQVSVRSADLRIATRYGIPVTGSGAAVAAIAAMLGAVVGKRVPRLGLPERPPGGPEGNGRR